MEFTRFKWPAGDSPHVSTEPTPDEYVALAAQVNREHDNPPPLPSLSEGERARRREEAITRTLTYRVTFDEVALESIYCQMRQNQMYPASRRARRR